MKASKGITKKTKTMDYTNFAYNEAVGRLKAMLADSYAPSRGSSSYLRNINDDSSDNMSVIERPAFSQISKCVTPSYKSSRTTLRKYKPFQLVSTSKENLTTPTHYQQIKASPSSETVDYLVPTLHPASTADTVHAPVEIFNFIEKQEDYIEQLEKESKFCRNELSNLLGKVKDVINENEVLTENARSELAAIEGNAGKFSLSASSESDEAAYHQKTTSSKRKDGKSTQRPLSGPNIIFESRISELEAELTQANIDLKQLRSENEDLKRKLAQSMDSGSGGGNDSSGTLNCGTHRKQIEHLQMDKIALEETIRQLQKTIDEIKSGTGNQYSLSSKRYLSDLVQMERSQADLEIKHLRDELDRQHERVRELQHEMGRRISEERSNAERRYNSQVDQLGGDLSNQWEQVAKLQLDLERHKRIETDLKRDVSQRNAQIDELKMELKSNRSTFLSDMAQANAEKQSLEQEITSLRLQLDRSERQGKVEAARLNAEINSLRQRLDRGDADLLHSKREVLRLNDEIANLEKELAYGEMRNEIRPTKKDLDKRISEMQDKHAGTVNELEEMIQSQKQLMDKLTNECKALTNKLEDTTLKHNEDKQHLRHLNDMLMTRLKQIWESYKELNCKRDQRRSPISCRVLAIGQSPATSDSEPYREEHFMKLPAIEQHHSSTNLPHTVLQNQAVTTPREPQTTYSQNLRRTSLKVPLDQLVENQQLHWNPKKSQYQMIQSQNLSQHQQQEFQDHQMTTNVYPTIMETTKISKTASAKAKSNNSSSSVSADHQLALAATTTLRSHQSISSHMIHHLTQQSHTTRMTTTSAAMPVDNPTTSIQPTQSIILPTTRDTKDTISRNTIPKRTEVPTISNMMSPNNHTMELISTIPLNHTTVHPNPSTRATAARTTISPINTIQQLPQQISSPMRQVNKKQQPQQHPTTHRTFYHQQAVESPRLVLAAQQQKAAFNRDRAIALWGQQVQEQSQDQNHRTFCRNSLPRHLKDYQVEERISDCAEMIDPFDLEFSISSPSLFERSCASDTESLSGSDLSASRRTAIQRIPI